MKRMILLLVLLQSIAWGISPSLNVQGVLRDDSGSAVPDGDYSIGISVYDAETGGTRIYTEEQSSVTVKNGVYSLQLGKDDGLEGLTFTKPYFVAISVNGGAESSPRIPLSMAPYALAVQGVNNVVPSDGNVGIGCTDPSELLELRDGNMEIQNDDADTQIRFHDPYTRWMYIGMDQSDGSKFKIGEGSTVGHNDYLTIDDDNGNTTIKGNITGHHILELDRSGSVYDVWVQGSPGVTSGGDDRNLALLGTDNSSSDRLYVNYNSEYKGGTDIGGPVYINGSTPILIRSYQIDDVWWPDLNTGVSVNDYSAVVVGLDVTDSDWAEDNSGHIWRTMMVPVGTTWHIYLGGRLHGNVPNWRVHVMFIRKTMVADQRTHWGW